MSSVEKNCRWHFATFSGGREDGPNEPMQENFKKTPYASLIRESIQNSLDVCLDNTKPVEMVFKIKSINTNSYPNFFQLKENVRGCLKYFNGNPNANSIYNPMIKYLNAVSAVGKKMHYIQVSDYNTKGMNYIPDDRSNSFYAFVRAAGVSAKADANAGGSFGYGKAAYFYLSSIRTIIVSTCTEEGKYFFEGVSSLCTHMVNGETKVAVGYYDNNEGNPIEDYELIPDRFKRKDQDGNSLGPGTDINIMGIDLSEISAETIYDEMFTALLRNFWLAIYENRLVVTIGEKRISAENLYEVMVSYFLEEHDNARQVGNYNPRPYLETVMHANEDSNHVLFECDLNEYPDFKTYKDEDGNSGKLSFYAWKTKNANNRIIYMRQPRMLVYGQRSYSANGYYGIFVCKDGLYNSFLRSMENPAHNEWNLRNNDNCKDVNLKPFAEIYVKFVDECIKKLFDYANAETLSIKGLDQYLYIPTDVENEDDEDANETLIGEPTGIIKDDGSSVTSTLDSLIQSPINKTGMQQGRVMVKQSKTAKRDPKGGLLSGNSNKPSKHKGGGAGSSNPKQRNTPVDDGTPGTYLNNIPVHYRAFAINKNGQVFHQIIINSDFDVENGEIQFLIGGDESVGKVNVVESSSGVPVNNTITNVQLKRGKNTFLIRFVDKMKHSIKIEAYEVK